MLVRDPKVYAQFLRRLDAAGMLTWKAGMFLCLGSEIESIARPHRLPIRAKLVPCLKVLPMGWSWRLYFAQKVHAARIANCGLDPRQLISDKQPGWKLDSAESKIVCAWDYPCLGFGQA